MFVDQNHKEIEDVFKEISSTILKNESKLINQQGLWPVKTMQAVKDKGLAGLMIPRSMGGLGGGLTDLFKATLNLGGYSGSAGLCFGMHAVACAVLSDKPTDYHYEKYIKPICQGKHITTLALSEPGTGVHFYIPSCSLQYDKPYYYISGEKSFVTNAGYADSYVVSAIYRDEKSNDSFLCALVPKGSCNMQWGNDWDGFGLKGNRSENLLLKKTKIAADNILGDMGDHTHYLFDVVFPNFLIAMAGTYLGVVRSAVQVAEEHLKKRVYTHTLSPLSKAQLLQYKIGKIQAKYRALYSLVYHAAKRYDLKEPGAIQDVMLSKAEVSEQGALIVNECMTIMGGMGYSESSLITGALRDIKAASIMSPTSDLIYLWVGRSRLGLSMLEQEW